MEEWRDIPNYEGLYQVSNLGRVKSSYGKGRFLETDRGGEYHSVCLSKKGKAKTFRVHVLVAICFLGHEPSGYHVLVDHKDDDKKNNNVENLQLITLRENVSKSQKGSSKYTGVCYFERTNKWRAYIFKDGKNHHLGYFDTELDAHKAYQSELSKITQ